MSAEEDLLARAGHYVLGLMNDDEREATERAMQTDPRLRDAVERLAGRMQALDDNAGEETATSELWRRIATAIDQTPQEQAASVVPMPVRPVRNGAPRMLAMAASLLVAGGLGYLVGMFSATPGRPVVVVVLQTPELTPGAVFEAFADNSVRIIPLEDFVVPDGKVMEVWTLYDRTVGPVSLGTLARSETTTLGSHGFPVPAAEQLYEITLEPSPGSPTGKPTGPILVKGFAKRPAG